MLPEIEALLVLQGRDRRLWDLQQELERIPREETRARSRLEDDQSRVDAATAALRECEVAIQKVELDAATRRTSIERLRKQQFETRKNEEYQALGHEVARYAAEVDALETRELELMEQLDALRAGLDEARRALATTRALVDEELAALAQRRAGLEHEGARLRAERTQLAAAVPESALPLYERLLKSKGGSALAAVTEAGQCNGCHMKLVAATLIRVQAGQELVQCENCGRILHPPA